ncbi:flagellar basal body rod protein FlgB [Sporosarcina sp. HYO08]|uniref:flagellar basal body rod protein FlgB n=1 Tax=Sporosarcina sp. HYO08 TaxID=1759557 RepID=UPI000798A254|nr:flagellar basal body rod protein FlgB [Sporosarcina sp. HYO08]KXH79975.1 flagellar biosynthesis protein FlgB [Sporosarcina sp. HYO08]
MNIYGNTINVLEQGLHYAATKSKTISQNIANVDTPNYKAKSTNFNEVLRSAQTSSIQTYRTHEKHIPFKTQSFASGVFTYSNFQSRSNGNGVDMDKEQADLATNQIYYHALVDRINGKFNTLQNVLKGGSR